MPTAAPRECSRPNCHQLVARPLRLCEAHRPKPKDNERPNSTRRGYGYTWQRLRRLVMHRQPICQVPGCHQPSEDVDHIVPRTAGGGNGFDNLQALCHRHHSRKTHRERGGGSIPGKASL